MSSAEPNSRRAWRNALEYAERLSDIDYRVNLENRLAGFGAFTLYSGLRENHVPTRGVLVRSTDLIRYAWVPCLRIKIRENCLTPALKAGSRMDVASGIVRTAAVRRYSVQVTTDKEWCRTLWKTVWGDEWKEGRLLDSGFLPKLLGNRVTSLPEWRIGRNYYPTTYHSKPKVRNSWGQYLAIMLFWKFWEAAGRRKWERYLELETLGLIKRNYSSGALDSLCKRSGSRFPDPRRFTTPD